MQLAGLLAQILNGLQYGLLLFLIASGLTLIFGVLNVINLAHGSLFMLEQMPKSHGARLEALEKNSHGRRRVVPTSTPAHAPAELRANGVQNMIRFHGNGSCSGRSIRNRLLIHR